MVRNATFLIVCMSLIPAGGNAATLYSISGEDFGVPRELRVINPETTSVYSAFKLGDGTTGFTGGLTWLPAVQKFWTIYDDGFGNNTLASFDLSGSMSLLDSSVTLAPGFYRGLTRSPHDEQLYAWYTDGFSGHEIVRIDLAQNSITSLPGSGSRLRRHDLPLAGQTHRALYQPGRAVSTARRGPRGGGQSLRSVMAFPGT